MRKLIYILFLVLASTGIVCCSSGSTGQQQAQEDTIAKRMLQGVWTNSEDDEPAFMVKGDSIFYTDSTSVPVSFAIYGDTLVLHNVSELHYSIVKQTENVFQFKNNSGDIIKLHKSTDSYDKEDFHSQQAIALNQGKLLKRDSVMTGGGHTYHLYVQVNPNHEIVRRTVLNDDGVGVDNMYFDNSIHIAVFDGNQKKYRHDFDKQNFSKYVPKEFFMQAILSDIIYTSIDDAGIHYKAYIGAPDSPTSYVLNMVVSHDGQLTISN